MTVEPALQGDTKPRVEPLNRPRMLTHGTLECRSLAASRPFYEEFLGLECVHHAPRAMMLRDLAQRAGMSPAKAHRYLVSFQRLGLALTANFLAWTP